LDTRLYPLAATVFLAGIDENICIGINVSAMHLGVALGAGLGGLLVENGALLRTPWVGSALVAVAFCLAWVSTRTASSARTQSAH
jgi:DHA1 family purine base/nucleoside efflux pump-like MFS transporter